MHTYINLLQYLTALCLKNVSDKSCKDNQNIHNMYVQKKSKNRAVYEKTWRNMVQREKPQIIIKHDGENMLFACWITEARIQTHPLTHSMEQSPS